MLRAALVSFLAGHAFAQSIVYDAVIRNGRVFDGTGNPWFIGDIAIHGDRIAAMGKLPAHTARLTLDARGLAVAPGFIDTHSHSRKGIFASPAAENHIRQGVTTVIEGPDGNSPLPLKKFLTELDAVPRSVNFGLMVGHGSVRSAVMGSQNRKATAAELQKMKELVRQGMLDGAFGLSTGLFYVPGNYAPTEEPVELARVAGALGGVHTSHVRNEAEGIMDSTLETIRIGEEGGLPTQITHVKVVGKAFWGKSAEVLKALEEARARGVDATMDQYPYTASSTGTVAMFPQWSQAGGTRALRERLGAPESRARIKAHIVGMIRDGRGGGDPKNIVMAGCAHSRALAGKSLADLTREKGREVTLENAAETAIELQLAGGCSAIYHAMSEADVERFMRSPLTMIASDGGIPMFGSDQPHPRNYGTFARVLGRYTRERGVLSWEEAIRKMSGFPAGRFGIWDRGLLRPGMKADVAVFDAAKVIDRADFDKPHAYAEGFVHVFVNGKAALLNGKMTGEKPGQTLHGPSYAGAAR